MFDTVAHASEGGAGSVKVGVDGAVGIDGAGVLV